MYRHLEPGEIRLLEILPTPKSWLAALVDKIECNLIYTRLDEEIGYEALSYCWGDPRLKNGDIVIVNHGRITFQVTNSLQQAIQTLQRTDGKRLIWVDSICINQQDNDEKAEQVSQMTEIYKGAQQVLGWLGPMTTVGRSVVSMNQFRKGTNGSRTKLPNPAWTTDFEIFLGNVYFSRLWIIQEVAVAQKVTLRFGKYEPPWQDFCDLLESFLEHLGLVVNTAGADIGLERIMMLIDTRNAVTNHICQNGRLSPRSDVLGRVQRNRQRDLAGAQKTNFAHLVSQGQTFGASDPRDRVFGLAGLVAKEDKRMVINYNPSNSAENVFHDFTLLTILHSQRLDILAQAGVSKYDLPSWVPDLTRRLSHTPLDTAMYMTNDEPFEYKHTSKSRGLIVSGYKIGTICKVVAGLANEDTTCETSDCFVPWQPADPIPPEKPRLLEKEVSTTFDIIGVLFSYSESRTSGTLNSYKDLARSLQTAVSALYDSLTTAAPRISVAMENAWYDSAMSTSKSVYTKTGYGEMLVVDPDIAGLPGDVVSKHKSFLANAWRNHLRDQPFKPVLANSYIIPNVPDELQAALWKAEDRNGRNNATQHSTDAGPRGSHPRPTASVESNRGSTQACREQDRSTEGTANNRSQYYHRGTDSVRENESTFWILNRAVRRGIERMSRGRRFAITDRELGMAWVPQSTHELDEIWILVGASVPFVLRPVVGRKGVYRLVGDAYHYSVMNGEYFTGEHQMNYTKWIDGPADFAQKEELLLI